MEHDKVYVIDEHKCLREGMTREQIKEEMISMEGAAGIPFGKCYMYELQDGSYINPVEKTISDSDIIPHAKFCALIDTKKQTFRAGDRIIIEGKCILSAPRALGIAVLTTGDSGDSQISETDLTIQGTSFACYSVDEYELMEFKITSDCEGYAAVRFATGKEFEYKNPKIYVLRNDRCVNLTNAGNRVYPSTCEIISKSGDFPFVERIGNREEHRFTEATITSPVTIRAELGGSEEFYAVIVSKISFSGTAADLIDVPSNCKVVNGELDVSEFTVVQITLYYDGFNICAVVSGY